MNFDALTYAGLFSAAVSGGFFIALATRNSIDRILGRSPTRSSSPRLTHAGH
jgi:hypothetical protein